MLCIKAGLHSYIKAEVIEEETHFFGSVKGYRAKEIFSFLTGKKTNISISKIHESLGFPEQTEETYPLWNRHAKKVGATSVRFWHLVSRARNRSFT